MQYKLCMEFSERFQDLSKVNRYLSTMDTITAVFKDWLDENKKYQEKIPAGSVSGVSAYANNAKNSGELYFKFALDAEDAAGILKIFLYDLVDGFGGYYEEFMKHVRFDVHVRNISFEGLSESRNSLFVDRLLEGMPVREALKD